jgi:hypothetical protein
MSEKRRTRTAMSEIRRGRWAKGLFGRAHQNVAVVALANEPARIAWAVLRRGERFAAEGAHSAV